MARRGAAVPCVTASCPLRRHSHYQCAFGARSGSVGNFLEWFDFALYGLFANEIAAVRLFQPPMIVCLRR